MNILVLCMIILHADDAGFNPCHLQKANLGRRLCEKILTESLRYSFQISVDQSLEFREHDMRNLTPY